MKIIRDGKEIELTREEIISAGWEYDQICRIEDLASVYELCELEPNEEKRIDLAKEIEPLFDRYLGLNNTYWEAYWETANMAIKDWITEE